MALRNYELSKQILEENHYGVIGLDVYSYKRGERKLSPQIIGQDHKYGKHCDYVFYGLYLNGKFHQVGLHNIIYAWYKGEVPLGYEVDHLDGDTFNNSPENLELVTRAENIRRKPLHANQYYYLHNHNEESWKKLHEANLAKKAELAARKEARLARKAELATKREARLARIAEKQKLIALRAEWKNYKNKLELEIKAAKENHDSKWHELISKRMTFNQYKLYIEAEKSETLLVQGEVINSTLLLKTGKVVNDILVY